MFPPWDYPDLKSSPRIHSVALPIWVPAGQSTSCPETFGGHPLGPQLARIAAEHFWSSSSLPSLHGTSRIWRLHQESTVRPCPSGSQLSRASLVLRLLAAICWDPNPPGLQQNAFGTLAVFIRSLGPPRFGVFAKNPQCGPAHLGPSWAEHLLS